MNSRHALTMLGCGLLALAGCGKKESSGGGDSTEYTIDLRQPGVGSTMQGTFRIDLQFAMNASEPGRPDQTQNANLKDEIVYRETILEWPVNNKRPSKSKILFEKWERGKDGGIGDEGVRQRIVGREVLFQKYGHEFEFRALDGQPIDPNVRIYLEQRYNELIEGFNAWDFLPGKPVQKNTPWDINVQKLLIAAMRAQNQRGALPFKTDKAKGSGRLLNVTEKDGRKYGTIELRVDLGELDMPKEEGLKVSTTGKMELVFTIEACIDGSMHDVKANAKMDFGIEATHPKHGSMKMTTKLVLDIVERETTIGAKRTPSTAKTPEASVKTKAAVPKPRPDFPPDTKDFEEPRVAPKGFPERGPGESGKSKLFDDKTDAVPPPSVPAIEKDPPKFNLPPDPEQRPPEKPKR